MDEQLFKAFASRIEHGYSYEEIERQFIAAGYTEDQVREFYTQAKAQMAGGAPEAAPAAASAEQTAPTPGGAASQSAASAATQTPAPEVGTQEMSSGTDTSKNAKGALIVFVIGAVIIGVIAMVAYVFWDDIQNGLGMDTEHTAEELENIPDVTPTEVVPVKEAETDTPPATIVTLEGDFELTLNTSASDGVVRRGESIGYALSKEDARTYYYTKEEDGSYRMRSDVDALVEIVSATDPAVRFEMASGTPLNSLGIAMLPFVSEEDLCTVRDTTIQSFLEASGNAMSIEEAVARTCADDGSARDALLNVPDGYYYVSLTFYADGVATATGVSPIVAVGDTLEPVTPKTAPDSDTTTESDTDGAEEVPRLPSP